MKTIALCSFKGGTAKTSTAIHVATALAADHSKRVLLIDFDAQANASTGLGFSHDSLNTMVPVLQGERILTDIIQPSRIEGLNIATANTYLDGVENTGALARDPYSHERLRNSLETVKDQYDFCFVDLPPSLNWLNQSALFAADYVMVCAVPAPYSVLALQRLEKYLEAVRERHPLQLLGVVLGMWDPRSATNDSFVEGIESVFPGGLFNTRVRKDVSVDRAILRGEPVYISYPDSRAGKDFKALTKEVRERCEASEPARQVTL